MIAVRVAPAPSMTTVWTGTSTGAGTTRAIAASRITPPAAPAKTPKKADANAAIDRPRKSSAPMLGAVRKCMLVLVVGAGPARRIVFAGDGGAGERRRWRSSGR